MLLVLNQYDDRNLSNIPPQPEVDADDTQSDLSIDSDIELIDEKDGFSI